MITKTKNTIKVSDLEGDYPARSNSSIYEYEAEVLAIRRLLKNKHFNIALDLGDDQGRLSSVLNDYADKVKVLGTSHQQSETKKQLVNPEESKFSDGSVDLAVMVRVMNRIIDPTSEFREIRRMLSNEGYAVIELANYLNVRNRFEHLINGKKLPKSPVEVVGRQSPKTPMSNDSINHNPLTVINQLAHAGLKVEKILSVSNLKSEYSNSNLLNNVLLTIEGLLQPTLAKTFFGTRVFLLVHRAT